VVVRDGDELRAFVNVCRHRAHLVATGRGRRNTLQCPYHAWTFGLDGCLRSAPRVREEHAAFAFEELGLRPVKVESYGPFVFVNPDLDAAPLSEALGAVPARIERSGVDLASLRLRRTVDWECKANWKNAIENYLECYHCAVAHPGFSAAIDVDPSCYLLETAGSTLSQYGPAKHPTGAPLLPDGEIEESQYHLIFPNTSIDIAPGPPNLLIYAWCPTSPATMAASSHYFFPDGVTDEEIQQIVDFNDQVNEEDLALIDAVQQGLDSGTVPFGRLMPESEQLIARFQRLVLDHVAREPAP
jgi:choline monooxygenase